MLICELLIIFFCYFSLFLIDFQWNTIFLNHIWFFFFPHKSLIWVIWGIPILKRSGNNGSMINDCRLIQEEKENTEARAEELEYRVSSLDHLVGSSIGNHAAGSGRSTPRVAPSNHSPVVPANLTAYANTSSPLASNQNAAASPRRDYLHKFHTVCTWFMLFF